MARDTLLRTQTVIRPFRFSLVPQPLREETYICTFVLVDCTFCCSTVDTASSLEATGNSRALRLLQRNTVSLAVPGGEKKPGRSRAPTTEQVLINTSSRLASGSNLSHVPGLASHLCSLPRCRRLFNFSRRGASAEPCAKGPKPGDEDFGRRLVIPPDASGCPLPPFCAGGACVNVCAHVRREDLRVA